MKSAFIRRMGRRSATLLLAAAPMILGLLLTRDAVTLYAGKKRTAVTPFVLQSETYSFDKDPRGRLFHRVVDARRADGTEVTVSTVFSPKARPRTERIIHYTDGRAIQLLDGLSAKTTWPAPPESDLSGRHAVEAKLPANNCAQRWEALMHYEILFGVRVAVVKTIPVDAFGTTSKRVPELGCKTIQYRVETVKAGKVVVQSEQRAVSLKLEEPDPELFTVGANYAELRPSELLRRELENAGVPWNVAMEREAKAEDQRYFELNKTAAPKRP